jgi:hypothetical protein
MRDGRDGCRFEERLIVESEESKAGLFDTIFAWAMKSRTATSILFVEERTATPEQLFRDDNAQFRTRVRLLRLAACALLSFSIFLIFDPIAEILSFLPLIDSLLHTVFFLAAVVLGVTLWALAAAVAWCAYRPHILAALTLAAATAFCIAGALPEPVGPDGAGPDGWGASDTAVGAALYGVSVLPLVLVARSAWEEARFAANVRRLNAAAGIA